MTTENSNDRNDGGATTMVATLWTTTNNDSDAVLIACRGINKNACCTDSWSILQQTLTSMNQDEFEATCVDRIAAASTFIRKDLYALFVSSSEGVKRILQDEKTVTWKQYTNGDWTGREAMIHPFAFDTPADTISTPKKTFSTSLHSTLASSGGMHRLLHHDIHISCPPNISDGTFYQGTLDMVVYVTEHFFIDANDALDDMFQSNTTPSLLSLLQIDIEEPAFSSPQHVVGIRVQVEGLCNNSNDARHFFATKLHTRYPPLTDSGDLQVAFPAPFLLNATLVIHQQSYPKFQNDVTWQAPIVTHVATGYNQDAVWVPMATILFSLIGSWWILKSMAHVSKWNET